MAWTAGVLVAGSEPFESVPWSFGGNSNVVVCVRHEFSTSWRFGVAAPDSHIQRDVALAPATRALLASDAERTAAITSSTESAWGGSSPVSAQWVRPGAMKRDSPTVIGAGALPTTDCGVLADHSHRAYRVRYGVDRHRGPAGDHLQCLTAACSCGWGTCAAIRASRAGRAGGPTGTHRRGCAVSRRRETGAGRCRGRCRSSGLDQCLQRAF